MNFDISMATIAKYVFITNLFFSDFGYTAVDNERTHGRLRYQLVNTNGTVSERRMLLKDDDILCETIFYVFIEAEPENNIPEQHEWICNIREDNGNIFAYALKNIPTQTFTTLMDNIESLSASSQMIIRHARRYIDVDLSYINIPFQTNNEGIDLEIIQNQQTQTQQMFPIQKYVLVIRVDGSEPGEEFSANGSIINSSELSRRVFGGFDDIVNLKEQYAACSANNLVIQKASGYDAIREGVLDIKLDVSTSEQTLKPFTKSTNPFLENKISEAAKAKLGVSEELENIFDLVMICLPEGTNVKTAYARLGGKRSVYNGEWCIFPSVQMHVIGHNLGLRHSNHNGVNYDDHLGLMGATYTNNHEFPRMCFNGVKSWLFGWYQDKSISLDPSPFSPFDQSQSFQLVGVTDYLKAPRGEYVVTIELKGIPNSINEQDEQVETAYYFQYNLQEGINIDTQEFANKVTVTKGQLKRVNNSLREKRDSSNVLELTLGQIFRIPDYKGSGINLLIKLCEENRSVNPSYAKIFIYFATQTEPCSSIIAPTPSPSIQPDDCSGSPRPLLDILGTFISVTFDP